MKTETRRQIEEAARQARTGQPSRREVDKGRGLDQARLTVEAVFSPTIHEIEKLWAFDGINL